MNFEVTFMLLATYQTLGTQETNNLDKEVVKSFMATDDLNAITKIPKFIREEISAIRNELGEATDRVKFEVKVSQLRQDKRVIPI